MLLLLFQWIMPYLSGRDLVYLTRTGHTLRDHINVLLRNHIIDVFGCTLLSAARPQQWLRLIDAVETAIHAPEVDLEAANYMPDSKSSNFFEVWLGQPNKYALLWLDSVLSLRRSLDYGCVIDDTVADVALSPAILDLCADMGVIPSSKGMVRVLLLNRQAAIHWMMARNIVPGSLPCIALSWSLKQYVRDHSSFSTEFIRGIARSANRSRAHLFITYLYQTHHVLVPEYLSYTVAIAPLAFAVMVLESAVLNASDLMRSAPGRRDILEYMAPLAESIPCDMLRQVMKSGNLATLRWALTQNWPGQEDVMLTAVCSKNLEVVQLVVEMGYSNEHSATQALRFRCGIDILDYLASVNYWPGRIEVGRFWNSYSPNESEYADWVQRHYWGSKWFL